MESNPTWKRVVNGTNDTLTSWVLGHNLVENVFVLLVARLSNPLVDLAQAQARAMASSNAQIDYRIGSNNVRRFAYARSEPGMKARSP
jgi:hypothetical protein